MSFIRFTVDTQKPDKSSIFRGSLPTVITFRAVQTGITIFFLLQSYKRIRKLAVDLICSLLLTAWRETWSCWGQPSSNVPGRPLDCGQLEMDASWPAQEYISLIGSSIKGPRLVLCESQPYLLMCFLTGTPAHVTNLNSFPHRQVFRNKNCS